MSHYPIVRWADFVRGLGDAAERRAMERHLAGGCKRCAALAGGLGRVAALAETDDSAGPPAGALRSVAAYFALRQREARRHLEHPLQIR